MKPDKRPKTSFDLEFCEVLEYRITKAFANSDQKELKWIWCDGISPELTHIDYVNGGKEINITTRGWIGESGQDDYLIVIHLSKRAATSFKDGKRFVDCIPSASSAHWLELDSQQRRLTIRLDNASS